MRPDYVRHACRLAIAAAVLLAPAVFSPSVLNAQESPEAMLAQHLFAPELVMQHQQKIDLKAGQRAAITQAIQRMQSRMVELQWRIQEETQKLAELLKEAAPSEESVLTQVDRVLSIEREIKREHMSMLLRIKNVLTPEQQAALRALR